VRANHNIKFLLMVPLWAGILVLGGQTSGADPAGAQADAVELMGRFAARTRGKVAELKSIRQLTTVSTRMGEQSVTMDQRVEMVFPDRIRRTMLMEGSEQAIVINAGTGFMAADELSLPLPPDRLTESVKQLGRDLLLLAASVGNPDLRANLVGEDERDGRKCHVIDVSLGTVRSRLCLDDEGTALSQSFASRHPMSNAPGTIEILFSDYRDTGGVSYPFQQVLSFDGAEMVTVTLQSLEINPDLPDSLFEIPSSE
jgi:outer membrane lipoprotein-sorting protein